MGDRAEDDRLLEAYTRWQKELQKQKIQTTSKALGFNEKFQLVSAFN